MTKIVIACDSFKESMSAKDACKAIEKGIKAVDRTIDCLSIPMADGGEGTTEILMEAANCLPVFLTVHDPFHHLIDISYGMNQDGLAIMDVALACGLNLIPKDKRDPTKALSTGVGEMIKDAIINGAKEIIIGLGGSGTNDGGFGLLYAIGAVFYDSNDKKLPLSYQSIIKINRIDLSKVNELLKNCQIFVASDVENVFTGLHGATYTFGKQKGASLKQLDILEKSLLHFQDIVEKQYHIDLSKIAKTGGAGGIGGALYLIKALLVSGIDLVLDKVEFEKQIKDANYIFTGEGSIDGQTINGKTISGIIKIAKKYHVPVIALAGRINQDATNLYDLGLTAMFSITNEAKPLKEALKDGKSSLMLTTQNIIRLL
ncbi:glycerate kinase, partial [Thomasclavelia sp.]|uniref:glycerate kinase family protein n=1 Tax=Thomasclavelia sp. TaxID=3025757 RepID=UPI0025D77B5F